MPGRFLISTTLLLLLLGCRREQLSLRVTHAATVQPQTEVPPVARVPRPDDPPAGSSCFSFIPLRPQNQRAEAVQERLRQADEMAAALDSKTLSVDLVGDHANVLSLVFHARGPLAPLYAERVSFLVEQYFSATQVEDDLCSAGFAAVKLSLHNLKDRRLHPLWIARVTAEGLLKQDQEEAEVVNPQVR